VALTVFVPEREVKPLILTVTYIVVLFAIIVKDPTVAPMARRLGDNPDPR
jgi:CPA1 family monovalent cation:H+ antiporter